MPTQNSGMMIPIGAILVVRSLSSDSMAVSSNEATISMDIEWQSKDSIL
jgi:hypothetical protein